MPAGSAKLSRKIFRAPRKMVPRYTGLLITELAMILIFPFIADTPRQAEVYRLLAVLVFAAALNAFLGRGRLTVIAFALATPCMFIHVANVFGYLQRLSMLSLLLGIAFLTYVTSIFIIGIISDPTVTTDTLAGAVSAYLLIGITYGLAYGLIEQRHPGSFRDTVQPGKVFAPSEFIFFSFVTLTTIGYGDIVPWGPHARALAILEGVTGIMYPAVLVARLVGLKGVVRQDRS